MNHPRPPFAKANSITGAEAAALVLASSARLTEGRAPLRAWRVAGAVWSLTVGYAKPWDTVFVDGLAKLAGMDERSTRRGLKECERVGALQWRPNFRQGHSSLVGLPDSDPETGLHHPGPNQPGVNRDSKSSGPNQPGPNRPDYLSDESMSVVFNTHNSSSGVDGSMESGEPHSSLIAASDSLDGSEDWEAERRAIPEAEPDPHEEWMAERRRRAAARFEPYHGDERGDGVGDSERE
jgi:hypothetical protein